MAAPPVDRSRCWGSCVTDFRVVLPKRVFVPGETVAGTLHLSTSAPVDCRSLNVRLEQRSVVHWHYGSGDDRKDYHGEQARGALCVRAYLLRPSGCAPVLASAVDAH